MAVGLIFSVCGDKPRIKIEIQNKTPNQRKFCTECHYQNNYQTVMYSKRPQSLDVRCIMLLIMLLVSAWLHSHGKDNFDVCDVIISTTTTYSLFSFISYLHYRCVLPYPLVEGGGKLFKLIEFFLCFGIEQWMSRWRLWEHIIQLGDIGDDRLLVRFGGINI